MLQQAGTFLGPQVEWFALSPMIVLLAGALGLMIVGSLTPTWPKGLYALVSAFTAGTAGALAMVQWDDITDNGPKTLIGGVIAYDHLSMFLIVTICVAVLLVSMLDDDYLRGTPNDGPEIYALLLVAAIGASVMASSNDLIVLFLGLETLSLAFYVLAESNRRSSESAEAGLKYFILGSFASAFFLYGVALVYGATGSTNFTDVVDALAGSVDLYHSETLILAGVALMLVGLGFKMAAVPFHTWAPDVYQGAPSPVSAFMASVGKTAAFAAMLRVLIVALPFYRDDWRPVIWVLAVLSMVIGSILAVIQKNVKRMLAYSSISHVGFILVGVEAAAHHAGEADPGPGVPSVVVYLLLYTVLVVGSFGVVAVAARSTDGETNLDSFDGLYRRRPTLAIMFTVFLLAQAGVPFTSGFIAKFGVIQSAAQVHSYAIAIIAMVSAVIAAFLYLRIVVSMWLNDPDENAAAMRVPLSAGLALGGAAVFTIFVGVYPGWLLDAADTVTNYAH